MTGYLSGKYIRRTARTPDQRFRDEDLFSELRVDMTAPAASRYEFHFFGTARQDLDGGGDVPGFDPFEDIGNTRRSDFAGYLYEAHADVNNLSSRISQVRIGRQAGTREEAVFFDGIAVDFSPAKRLNMTVYGGAAVHFYELGADYGSDTLAGAGVDYSPAAATGLSLDYLSVKDERNFFQDADRRDSLISVKLWQRFARSVKATAKMRMINGESRDLNVRALGSFQDASADLSVNYFRQFKTQNELANEFSPFFDILGQSRPFQSYTVRARKIFASRYAVGAGYFQRSLLESAEQDAFNREFSRAFGDVEIADIFLDNLSLTVTGERWKSGGRAFTSSGADLSYVYGKRRKGRVSAGTYYSLFKFDLLQLGERTKVRTYYTDVKVPLGRNVSLNGGYEFETGTDRFQTAKAGVRYDF
jgi:hypothetical protein